MGMTELMTITAYAQSVGLDKSTISKQVKAGQIPVVQVPGRKWAMIDPVAANEARARNLDNAKSHTEPLPEQPATESELPLKTGVQSAYTEARATSVALDVQKKQIELMRQRGELVLKRQVEDGAQKTARMVRDRILAVADDLAEAVFGSDNVNSARVVLRAGLKTALGELADSLQQPDNAANAAA